VAVRRGLEPRGGTVLAQVSARAGVETMIIFVEPVTK
jgi:hypothetical protein